MATFVKAIRSEEAAFLDQNPIANHMLNVIARRARITPCLRTGLDVGECFIGHKGMGLSEQQYRTAKKNLTKWELVEFKKARRVTDQGTVAKLLNSSIYDLNTEDPNGRATEEQRKSNGRVTEGQRQTKNERKKERKEELLLSSPTGEDSPKIIIPYSGIVDLYHKHLPTLPRVEKLTETRKRYIKNLWFDKPEPLDELDEWRSFFEYVGRSDFLVGKVNNGSRPFKASLEWITKPANYVKISEGQYHG